MTRWNPWRELRARSAVRLWFADLDGDLGRWERTADGDEILLDERLGRRERREVLAHELVHQERAVGWPVATAATMETEEDRVWRTALDRLAPPEDVAAFLRRRGTAGPVLVHELADEFDLTDDAAREVMRLLAVRGILRRRRRARRP